MFLNMFAYISLRVSLKIMHSNLTNKIKAQPMDFYSVSCAFFLAIYHLFINDFVSGR